MTGTELICFGRRKSDSICAHLMISK